MHCNLSNLQDSEAQRLLLSSSNIQKTKFLLTLMNFNCCISLAPFPEKLIPWVQLLNFPNSRWVWSDQLLLKPPENILRWFFNISKDSNRFLSDRQTIAFRIYCSFTALHFSYFLLAEMSWISVKRLKSTLAQDCIYLFLLLSIELSFEATLFCPDITVIY